MIPQPRPSGQDLLHAMTVTCVTSHRSSLSPMPSANLHPALLHSLAVSIRLGARV